MSEPTGQGTTNETPDTVVDVTVDCNTLWSAAHQFAYLRLSEDLDDNAESLEVDLLDSYYARARRIAGTYAKNYLELDEGGDPSKKGRYYWLALGAFASKTVACLLDHHALKGAFLAGRAIDPITGAIDSLLGEKVQGEPGLFADYNIMSEGLGLGNFWLFMDIMPWHWFYSNYPEHFHEGMSCGLQRNAATLLEVPKQVVTENLQWAKYALPKVNFLTPTNYIMEGMQLVAQIETMIDSKKRTNLQFSHLQVVANHEQEMILQKLIYENDEFVSWIKKQRRAPLNWYLFKQIMPTYELVFTSGCSTEYGRLKSVAPDDIEIEILGALDDGADSKTRMGWIGQVAEDFHDLMLDNPEFIESQLQTMAGWVDQADAPGNFIQPESFTKYEHESP